ncbi:MAG: GAF domain-containing protein [Nitrospinae bacterium]|nr:GAF domain-containing protein [Nitrospinota bacterium]
MPQTLEEELNRLVGLAGNVTDAFTAALFLVDDKRGDTLKLKASQSLSTNIIRDAEFPIGYGLVGWVAKNERPLNASNFKGDTTGLQFYLKDEDIKSFAAAPLFDGDRIIGVLSVDSKASYVFTKKMEKILEEFAAMAASVIVNGRKRIKLGVEAVALDTLNNVIDKLSACEKIQELAQALRLNVPRLIPHDFLALALKSFDDENFYMIHSHEPGSAPTPAVALPLTQYRLGLVIQRGSPIYLPDTAGGAVYPGCGGKWSSMLAAPMVANGQSAGAIGLLARNKAAFRKVDMKSLTILASACASAFTGLYMHNKGKKAVYMDSVTRLMTHRYLIETGGVMKGNGALIIVNLLNFTKVNAQLGHHGGDAVLKETAERLKVTLGGDGAVCRYYGDRFIISLNGYTSAQTTEMIQSIVDAIEMRPYTIGGFDIRVAPVIGVAVCPEDGKEMEELIAKAHHAAEVAKETPGMRVSMYSEKRPEWTFRLKSMER